jgi:hypothetical protein
VRTGQLSADDALLARLQAPPDLSEGAEALAYWRGRRRRLPWYRVIARREAAQMTAVWERRVRAALVQQRGLPAGLRLQAVQLVAGVWFRRFTKRLGFALALTGMLVLVVAPAVLMVELLVHLL